ncbi:hypothetical protein Cni_G22278 [Canna indica]|uniref:Uncharacterized protein n=1 Tax=Canna indica TaxID=4628 RepID=A0AAQ3KUV0_9LILI|nr:hypothetical protein Cni_G22278 [Canna indica]
MGEGFLLLLCIKIVSFLTLFVVFAAALSAPFIALLVVSVSLREDRTANCDDSRGGRCRFTVTFDLGSPEAGSTSQSMRSLELPMPLRGLVPLFVGLRRQFLGDEVKHWNDAFAKEELLHP